MRTLPLLPALALASALVLSACESPTDVVAPEEIQPQFHTVQTADPDGDYSLYFFDLNLRNDLIVKVAQAGDLTLAQCPGNTEDNVHGPGGEDPDFPGVGSMLPAWGTGSFVDRSGWYWIRGLLFVEKACWFDEWNDEGFPESAWVAGHALVGFRWRTFTLKLRSGGFPAEGHLFTLDWAELEVEGGFTDLHMGLYGELHHEDGLTLVQ